MSSGSVKVITKVNRRSEVGANPRDFTQSAVRDLQRVALGLEPLRERADEDC